MDREVKVGRGCGCKAVQESTKSPFPVSSYSCPAQEEPGHPQSRTLFLQEPPHPHTRPVDTAPAVFIRMPWWQGWAVTLSQATLGWLQPMVGDHGSIWVQPCSWFPFSSYQTHIVSTQRLDSWEDVCLPSSIY